MTRLAVVAYPILDEADHRWIESIRVEHDPQAGLIGVHFTLVFPAEADHESVGAHVRSVVGPAGPIRFAAHEIRAVRDPSGGGGHVLLVPDEGYGELVALHDRLYEGPLLDLLRRDIPYVPHMTVAAYPVFDRCEALARELGAAHRVLQGRVESVDVLDLGEGTVRSRATFALSRHESRPAR
jgi:2'-5' RNA ligase